MTTFSCQGGTEQNLQNGDLGLFEHNLLLTSIKTKCIDSEHMFDDSSHSLHHSAIVKAFAEAS